MGFFAEGVTRVPVNEDGSAWVEFRNSLTFGEVMDLSNGVPLDDTPEARAARHMASLRAYLADWHLTKADGTPEPFTPEAIAALHPDFGLRLLDLLNQHIGKEREGKAQAAAPPPTVSTSATPPSTPT